MGTLPNWIALCLSVVVVTHCNPANTLPTTLPTATPSTATPTVTLGAGSDGEASDDSIDDVLRNGEDDDDGTGDDSVDDDDGDGTGDDSVGDDDDGTLRVGSDGEASDDIEDDVFRDGDDDGVIDSAGMVYTLIDENLLEDDYNDEDYFDEDYYDDYDDFYFDGSYEDQGHDGDHLDDEMPLNYTLADDSYTINRPKEIVMSDEEINELIEKRGPAADGDYSDYFDYDDYSDYDYEDEEGEEGEAKYEEGEVKDEEGNNDSEAKGVEDEETRVGGEEQQTGEGKEEAGEENTDDHFLSFQDYNITFHKNNITFSDYIGLYNISFEDYNISFEEFNISSEGYPFADYNVTLVDFGSDLEDYPEFNVTLEDFNATYEEYENGTVFDVTFVSNEVLDSITKAHNATDGDDEGDGDEVEGKMVSTTDSSDDAGRPTTESPQPPPEPGNLRSEREVDMGAWSLTPDECERVYDSLIASGLLRREEEEEVRALERMRRSIESLGGMDALRGSDELTHHVVKRQLTGGEACGTFSRRRRRETGEPPSSFPASPSSSRKRRGISNVGKRLEQDNANFKQLYNQYKIMCRFVAMMIFEK
ncbi:protein PFC0760c-like [Penaeus indicus]|uniref:protein PFC0760c-like n=1 Tax=Penaeus indicus TaxID=29960 RepID=UPI00300D5909